MRLSPPLLALATLTLASSAALAEEVLGNPFASAKTLLAERATPKHASVTLVYDTARDGVPGSATLKLARDWASIDSGQGTRVYDFAAGRVLSIDGTGLFANESLNAAVYARVQERVNRDFLSNGLRSLGVEGVARRCDQDAELGVSVPAGAPDPMVIV